MYQKWRILGILSLLAGWLFGAGGSVASARTVLDLDSPGQPRVLADWGDYWIDPTGQAELSEVLKLSAATLQPTRAGYRYPVMSGQTLWIRFTVPPAADAERWYIKVADPALDRVVLYTRTDIGWTVQVAGDRIPVADWPLPHLYPLLPLRVSAADLSVHLLRIETTSGFSVPIEFISESSVSLEQQRVSLWHGVYFGLVTMVALMALVSGVIMRDLAYLWFGLYGMAIVATVATGVGVAGLHLWPRGAEWADASKYVLPPLSFAPLMLFLAWALSLRSRATWAFWTCCALAAVAVLSAAAVGLLGGQMRQTVLLTSVLGLALAGVLALLWAWRHGDRFARWLLLAFTPLLAALPFPVGRWLDWMPISFLSQHAVQLALAITLPVLYLLLILRSQERHDYRRRITHLDHVDPLTGLVNDEVFAHRMQGLIERAFRYEFQSAVVLIEFTNMHKLGEEFGRKAVLEVLLRLAGRLNSLVREVDTVARVGASRYGLLIEGPVPADRAAQLGAKVLARLILPFSGMPMGLAVRPKVAVVMVPAQGGDVAAILARLDAVLKGAPPDYKKNIYVVDGEPASAPQSLY